uniref:Reverse transcriptase zinc-binding domain-containing protein n=1 Tax=Populus alba TaxID=43335 RepID=A0A4U5R122_POPAL|nr:hypothetical protein D5086_0000020690 [Populus alba]
MVLKSSLDRFSTLSGLSINLAKSSLYLSGIISGLRNTIIEQLGIQETTLPVKYLGVPLLSSRLTHRDCLPLLERIIARIKLWTSSSLTYAGRLQLIKSVLFSIQVYWSTIFILPCATIKRIESTLAAFLWKGSSLTPTGAKVAWNAICYPLTEGGLRIKKLKTWNQAATLKHIWHLFTDKESMWSTWIQANLLRGKSFWQVTMPSNPSWSWRKILQSRDWCRGWFINRIGNGNSTSLWFDYWLPGGLRLIDNYSLRTLTATGLMWNARNLLQWASATYGNKIDVKHLIACLLLSATVYQLWYERNNRIFSNQFQVATTIAETVFQQVRMHITSMEFRTIILTSICAVWGIRQPHQNLVPVADS